MEIFKIYSKFSHSKEHIKIISDFEEQVPKFIYTNKRALKHIIMNLLTNSMKFTYQGEIKVICKLKSNLAYCHEKKCVEISVIDTGIGIEKENIKKICQPFSLTTSEDKAGSGLGLSIVIDLLDSINSQLY